MKPPRKAIFAIVPIAILLLPVAVYLADTALSNEEVARNVSIAGLPVGGLTSTQAQDTVNEYESALRADSATFTVNEVAFELNPWTIGLSADVDTAVNTAMEVRRDGNVIENFTSWLKSFGSQEEVPLTISYSDDAIVKRLDQWQATAVANPAFNGAVTVVDGVVTPEYPQTGDMIDTGEAVSIIKATMSSPERMTTAIPVITSEPSLTSQDIDAAVAEMQQMIGSEITLRSNEVGVRVSFSPHDLESAVTAKLSDTGDAMVVSFDEHGVLHVIDPLREQLERQPVDATYDVNLATNAISVVPGREGTLIDMGALLIEMKRAALSDGTGVFPLIVGAQPSFTAEEAQAFLPSLGLLGEFTTEHPAGQDRIINIQKMAKDVDGVVVLPGDDWSINDEVGIRTLEKGYVAAPAIINGQPYCCDSPANIGGGVSQFGTTLFNAVFFSCLEDVEHQPHSLSFTRYPSGREATLGFPKPDIRFRNNTEFPVVIKTSFKSTSITVKMFGNNGGKTCTADTAERESIVEAEDELVADTEGKLLPGQKVKERNGIDGYLQRVDRIVTYPDGRQEIDLKLVWRYRPLTTRYIVHPCEVTGEPINCPLQIPSVAGQTWEQALATLSDIGMLAAKQPETVTDASKNNIVLSQTPAKGEWITPGSTITLTVGAFP
ncbi:MAG: VanW family protein [Acidimicrobiia bacterium]